MTDDKLVATYLTKRIGGWFVVGVLPDDTTKLVSQGFSKRETAQLRQKEIMKEVEKDAEG